ncbi:MAG: hypothetical protein HY301_09685 [Verrucomicrobia bacterium]|nr:hypothetical protein [Verrucomicrobiota bacterium]
MAIAHDHVQLKTGDQVIELPVKMQLRRENAGEWKLLAMTENFTPSVREPEPREGSAPASQFTTRSSSSSKGSRGEPPPGEISEKALKKMEDQFKSAMKEEAKAEKELKSATAPTSGKSSKKSSKRSRQP